MFKNEVLKKRSVLLWHF